MSLSQELPGPVGLQADGVFREQLDIKVELPNDDPPISVAELRQAAGYARAFANPIHLAETKHAFAQSAAH